MALTYALTLSPGTLYPPAPPPRRLAGFAEVRELLGPPLDRARLVAVRPLAHPVLAHRPQQHLPQHARVVRRPHRAHLRQEGIERLQRPRETHLVGADPRRHRG